MLNSGPWPRVRETFPSGTLADDIWLLMLRESWTNEPNVVGTATFQQYFSAGHNKSSGILTTADNLMVRANLWTKHNYQSGELEECKVG